MLQKALNDVPEKGRFHWGSEGTGMHDKLLQLQRMKAAGVRTVPFTDLLVVARKWHQEDGETVFGRFRNHERGTDITVNKVINTTRTFWTKYVPSRVEWRIHIFDGRSIARWCKLYPPMPEVITEEVIRARAFEYNATARVEPPDGMRLFAKEMVEACEPLSYGACDILLGTDGKFYALEVNTAPALDEYTLEAYVKAIRRRFAK
jgi:hypothetical protein